MARFVDLGDEMFCSSYQQEEGGLLGCDAYRRSTKDLSSPMRENFINRPNSSSKQFLRSLRTLLLRIRMAGQLRQDFAVEKHFVELRELCRRVCAELRTPTAVADDLWVVVRQRRGDASSSHQHSSSSGPVCSLAQDAETVSRAGDILRRAAAANSSGTTNFDPTARKNSALEDRPSAPSSPSSKKGDGNHEDDQSSARCPPRQGLRPRKENSRNPKQDADDADPPPTGAGSVSFDNPADALPLLALAETLGVGNAVDACLDFITTEKEAVVAAANKRFSSTLHVTSGAPPPSVDWAVAVQRLAAWPRRSGGVAVASQQRPTVLLSPAGESEQKDDPSPPSPSPPQGYECSMHFCGGLRRATNDKRGATAVAERSTQCPDHEAEYDAGDRNHLARGRRERGAADYQPRPSNSRLWSESPQAPSTNPAPPPPPPWPKVAFVEPTAACFEDGARRGRVGSRRERCCGDRPKTSIGRSATAEARCCCQQVAHRGVAAPLVLGGCSARGEAERETRTSSSELIERDGQHVAFEEGVRDDDRSEQSLDDMPRDVQNRELEGGGGSDGRGIGEQYCDVPVVVDSRCCRDKEDSTTASRAPGASLSRATFPSRAVAHSSDDAVEPAILHRGPTRVGKQSPSHPSERWPCGRFESGQFSDRQDANGKPTNRQCSHSTGYDDNEDDSDDNGGGDVEAVQPDPRKCNIKFSSGAAVGVSARPEDGDEAKNGDDGEQDDESSSCALARKRALLRVRLARQRHELAIAVVDANERGLRAERRRRREEKLAVLLTNARRDSCGVDVGSGGCAGNQGARGRQLVRDTCSKEENVQTINQTGARKPERTSRGGVGTTLVPSGALGANYSSDDGGGPRKVGAVRFNLSGGCRRKEEEEHDQDDADDDDEVPRKPLGVVPVESSTRAGRSRSRCWRKNQKGRGKSEGDKTLGQNRVNSYPSPSFCQVVVWIDALYAFEGQRESFDGVRELGGGDNSCRMGGTLYLLLEDRFTRYRTAGRRRHRVACEESGRASRANAGQAFKTDGRDGGVDAWIFHETVALNVARHEGKRRGGQEQGREEVSRENDDDDDGDNLLQLRLCVAQSSSSEAGFSSDPALQETDPVALAGGEAPPDEVIGSAAIPLGRCLAAAERSTDGARSCTFSRPIRASVVDPAGLAIGWVELGVCGSD